MLRVRGLLTCLLGCALVAGEPLAIPKPLTLERAENLHDLRYLPAWRSTGRSGPRGDWEQTLNLYLPRPRPAGRLPLVLFVHGGAYSAGHKDEGYPRALLQTLVDGGFAVGSLNYILTHRGIFPQVWWDFEEAARFLRRDAERHGLDPNAFAAVGISAGGWLITTSGTADGSLYTVGINSYQRGEDLRDGVLRKPLRRRDGEASVLRPTLAPATAYPGLSGRWQVLAYDFQMTLDFATGGTPTLIQMVGAAQGPPEAIARAGVPWFGLHVVDPGKPDRFAQGVHAPSFDRCVAVLPDGSRPPMVEALRDLLRRELAASAPTPVPEIWPADRWIDGPTDLRFVTTDPAAEVVATVDGSDPTADGPAVKAPLRVDPGQRVRALARLAGRPPSRIVEARFELDRRPRITAPLDLELPPGTTGQPYECRFTADRTDARWHLQGDLRPNEHGYPNGMLLDASGRFAGTPRRPGTYWLQVWVDGGPGTVGRHRDYRWTVTGADLGGPDDGPATADDHQQVAVLSGIAGRELEALTARLQAAGLRVVLQETDRKTRMVLVPAGQAEEARRRLGALAAGIAGITVTAP